MIQIKAVKKITVTEQIMEQIAQLIRSGQLKPGQQLPAERELAEQLGVTRGRVREALRALSLVGLISIRAGEGSFVTEQQSPLPPETIIWMFHHELHNLEEVYAARKLIESEVYLCAASRAIGNSELAKLTELYTALRALGETANPERFMEVLDRFDLYVSEICGNRIYAKLMQTVVYLRQETSLKLLGVPGAMLSSIDSRGILLDALKSHDAIMMQKALDSFFDAAKKFYANIGKSQG